VLKRDRGVCKSCRIDTLVAGGILKRSRGPTRQRLLNYWDLPSYTGRSLWEADHITPVVEGGGECDLSNLRTLCLRCHRMATLGLRLRRAEARQLARLGERTARALPQGELAAISTPALS
jgi:5-methylcytosine-specific restriction endonuclease McrA